MHSSYQLQTWSFFLICLSYPRESKGTSLEFIVWFTGLLPLFFLTGYQAVAGRFFFFMLTLILVSYTATAMSLAISAGMDVVAVANLLITICFVLMLVSLLGGVCSFGGGKGRAETS